ncbi:hypothetical protein FKG94_16410 [Exilibacterium tricleocarpae]|uniref:Uncharacterized protein n=1 Tax=Exilibacterium tricleocarpae TaxID=2591008 RepID=A0A545TAE2_9GAMM|nr:hypothetical protein [Exilibacterium tricleocarpae]TQV74189.1 hypothetical protein FKG94_16410 [Exilibacterium tricleocarpae]
MFAGVGRSTPAFLGAAIFAGLAPVLFSGAASTVSGDAFPGWPDHYEEQPLTPLQLSHRERLFVQDFPGRIGRFSDGRREIIMRWIATPTRRLHPAADCFRGVGYAVTPLPVEHNQSGIAMGCFRAVKDTQTLRVCEYIAAADGTTWTDVSAWYWQTAFAGAAGGWWSLVVAQRSDD